MHTETRSYPQTFPFRILKDTYLEGMVWGISNKSQIYVYHYCTKLLKYQFRHYSDSQNAWNKIYIIRVDEIFHFLDGISKVYHTGAMSMIYRTQNASTMLHAFPGSNNTLNGYITRSTAVNNQFVKTSDGFECGRHSHFIWARLKGTIITVNDLTDICSFTVQ